MLWGRGMGDRGIPPIQATDWNSIYRLRSDLPGSGREGVDEDACRRRHWASRNPEFNPLGRYSGGTLAAIKQLRLSAGQIRVGGLLTSVRTTRWVSDRSHVI